MKVLVISDSHGNSGVVKSLIDRYKNDVQTIVHLGDNAKDLLQFDTDYPAINFVVVAGNCDYFGGLLSERMLTVGNTVKRQLLLMHGHRHNVKLSHDRLVYYALEKGADACLFGHSHMPYVHVHKSVFVCDGDAPRELLLMNPGSVSEPRGGSQAGYGLLSIDDEGNITCEVLVL